MTTTHRPEHVLGFDTTLLHLADIDARLRRIDQDLLPAGAFVCTHVVSDPSRYAVTVATPSPLPAGVVEHLRDALGPDGCPAAVARFGTGDGGRAVVFPGQERLTGTLPAAQAVAVSAIDRVEVLGGLPLGADDLLDTRDFVRPLWRDGALVLPVLPAGPGRVAPFEVPNPTPCCGGY